MGAEIVWRLPGWLVELESGDAFPAVEDRVRFAIRLARENVARGTGGPFGAAVFERSSGMLIAAGVNLVVPAQASIAHAEMVALTLAQRRLGTHDLSDADCELAASAEPCAMCLGAIPWSGVRGLLCAAREEDARAVGFDEGAKPADWVAALRARSIEVVRDVLREEGAAVLTDYLRGGGMIYNPGRGSSS